MLSASGVGVGGLGVLKRGVLRISGLKAKVGDWTL